MVFSVFPIPFHNGPGRTRAGAGGKPRPTALAKGREREREGEREREREKSKQEGEENMCKNRCHHNGEEIGAHALSPFALLKNLKNGQARQAACKNRGG